MKIALLAGLVMASVSALPASSQITPDAPLAFDPADETAIMTTGQIILTRRQIIYTSGAMANLTYLRPASDAPGAPDLYAYSRQIGEFLEGNSLCDAGNPPEYVTIGATRSGDEGLLNVLYYQDGDEPRTETEASSACATSSYKAPAEWLDDVLPKIAPEVAASGNDASSQGDWIVERKTNPIDDSKTIVLTLLAESGASARGNPITLHARCQSNSTELFVNWNDYLGDDSRSPYSSWKRVTLRVGDEPAQQQQWSISTDHKATFAPNWAGNLLKQMLTADKMILQVTPYSESPVTAVFNITGLAAVLPELAETCNWSV